VILQAAVVPEFGHEERRRNLLQIKTKIQFGFSLQTANRDLTPVPKTCIKN
jgi:hypothetical protein